MNRFKWIAKSMIASLFAASMSMADNQVVDNAHVIGVYCSVQYNCSAYFDKDLSISPAGGTKCATSVGVDARRFQFDGASPIGKSMLAILLSAQASQSLVYAEGLGTCNIYSKVEDLNTVFIHN